ncbi:calcium/manganese antiporter SLC30A10 isoform X2 [Phyllobates terribilis]|uniref:calcium/manganese antiporter SLC30A10 isoform X2 n=1 Tax=Phyllobates terribilis TaxID=111132 RepID=UPI003CCB6196
MGRYTGKSARLVFMCVVHFFLFIAELAIGYIGNSLSLSSDGFAVLSHLISMIIGLLGVRFSRVQWHKRNTYGFLRADAVGAFGNGVFACALMFSILVEAIKRFIEPEKTENALLVLIAGVVGLAINVLNYVIFMDCCFPKKSGDNRDHEKGDYIDDQESDLEEEKGKNEKDAAALNIRGVMLHVMGDALGSVVVVVAAVIFYVRPLSPEATCNWQCYIDPSLTVVMVAIILFSAFPLIKETAIILLQMVPKGINVGKIGEKISVVPGVKSIHEIHVWELASGKNIATLHVKFENFEGYSLANHIIRKIFHAEGVHAVTLQAEFTEAKDISLACTAPCISKKCDASLCCSQELVPFGEMDGKALRKGKTSQVWYKSNDIITDVEIPIEPSYEETPEIKVIANGISSENESLNNKATRF